MEWLFILPAAVILVAAALAIAAALAAGGADREREAGQNERAAAWAAGFTDRDLRVLAGLAADARTELEAAHVEVVLGHVSGSGDGVVVTGSHVPAGRLGAPVARGEGLAGRGLAAERTLVERGVACVPVPSHGRVVGVVVAAPGEQPFAEWHLARLEALADDAGRRLGPRSGTSGHGSSPRRDTG